MAPPRNFSEDGAVGAGTDLGTEGSQTGGFQQSDAGMSGQPPASTPGPTPPQGVLAMAGGAEIQGGGAPRPIANTTTPFAPPGTPVYQPPGGYGVYSFDDGGDVGDDQQQGDDPNGALPSSMDGMQQSINQALATVDNALSYGRKLHGLPDTGGLQQDAANMPARPPGQSESGIPPLQPAPGPLPPTNNPFGKRQQMAQAGYQNNRMPAKPGNQSESGVPPLQPEPGPLPPTSNPFGKRADNDSDDDDQGQGAIPDNDEDTA